MAKTPTTTVTKKTSTTGAVSDPGRTGSVATAVMETTRKAVKAVTREAIAARAYAIYQHRQATGKPGSAESDWKQAEWELKV